MRSSKLARFASRRPIWVMWGMRIQPESVRSTTTIRWNPWCPGSSMAVVWTASWKNSSRMSEGSLVEAVLWDETIRGWLDDYPPLERHELERRLVSRERVAALFELLLHAILKRHGAQVTVHPASVSKTANRPDFLAVFPDGYEVVLESVLVNELSVKEASTSNAWRALLNHINRIDSDFWIHVDRHPGPLPSPPPPRKG